MPLALALYASTAYANTPHCDLDLLYHDGRAHRLDRKGHATARRAVPSLPPPRVRRRRAMTSSLTDFLPRLQSSGISTETIRVITVDNPRRALTGSK